MIIAGLAFLGAFLSSVLQAVLVVTYHRRGYRPALWLRVVLALVAIISFLVADGYLVVFLGLPQAEAVRVYWLRPAFALLLLFFPAVSLYALQQAAVHNDIMRQQLESHEKQTAVQQDLIRQQIEFRQNASHELRTPLTIIKGFSEMLAEHLSTTPPHLVQEYLGYIHHQAQNMEWLTTDLLHFERATALNPLIDGKPFDLALLVERVVVMIRESRARPLGVDLNVGVVTPVWGFGFEADIERVLNNLVFNAVKFSPPDNSGGTVRVSLARTDRHAILTVADTGIGIAPEFMPHLFEPFRQGDGTDTRRFGGMGIGLAVVKRIVTAHGGHIEVSSVLGAGSIFQVFLRVHEQ